ncbi:MAG TPA: hypothetical protein VK211_22630 [Kamptonema sp.]|nr:hypothetical protein [Kamptonema sp.]
MHYPAAPSLIKQSGRSLFSDRPNLYFTENSACSQFRDNYPAVTTASIRGAIAGS